MHDGGGTLFKWRNPRARAYLHGHIYCSASAAGEALTELRLTSSDEECSLYIHRRSIENPFEDWTHHSANLDAG